MTMQAANRILVVDDDAALSEMLQLVLQQEGYETRWCARGDQVVDCFQAEQPDLILLDLMLPGQDGVDVCRQIRALSGVPIIMVTAKTATEDVVLGLEAGADDYVIKPFKRQELIARVQARLRRPTVGSATSLTIGDLTIRPALRTVHRGSQLIPLTPLEFDLLLTLASQPQQAFSREQLLGQVWGYRCAVDTRLVNVHVQRLRAKIEHDPDNPEIVVTVRGVGYRAGSVW
ncbi:MAG: response regulator transcription factor [Propionibacteriaceae bacterium]|jgi:two-component system response regulator MtrA|nr:response regulator transcription factor [Propionibacteriaceae bacterium]